MRSTTLRAWTHTAAVRAGGRARVCASLYFGSRSSSVSLTVKGEEKNPLGMVLGTGSRGKMELLFVLLQRGASRLLSPSASVHQRRER